MDIREPAITRDEILILDDENFNRDNVCIISGVGTGIGRAAALAAGVNGLSVVGLDINEAEGRTTREMVGELGGEMTFVKTDLSVDADIEAAVTKAAEAGAIKYLANIAGIQHIDSVEAFPMEKYDLMQRIMLRAPFYLSKLAIPHMKRSSGGTGGHRKYGIHPWPYLHQKQTGL